MLDEKTTSTFSTVPKLPTGVDGNFPMTLGLIVSCRYNQIEMIRQAIIDQDGKIVYQNPTNGDIIQLRMYQVEKILSGDTSELRRIYEKKKRVRPQ